MIDEAWNLGEKRMDPPSPSAAESLQFMSAMMVAMYSSMQNADTLAQESPPQKRSRLEDSDAQDVVDCLYADDFAAKESAETDGKAQLQSLDMAGDTDADIEDVIEKPADELLVTHPAEANIVDGEVNIAEATTESKAVAGVEQSLPERVLEIASDAASEQVEEELQERPAEVKETVQSTPSATSQGVPPEASSRTGQCWAGLMQFFRSGFAPYNPHESGYPNRQTSLEDRDLQQALLESAELASFSKAKQDSAEEARERLKHVMEQYNAEAKPVKADGNCQFRALAQQLYGDEDLHAPLRAQVVKQLKANPECYEGFVYEPFSDYLERMASNGEWGDNVTLQAASDVLRRDIHLLTDLRGGERIMVCPAEQFGSTCDLNEKPLCLTFLTEVHYDAAEIP